MADLAVIVRGESGKRRRGGRAAELGVLIRLVLFAGFALIGVAFLLLPLVKDKIAVFSPMWFYGLTLIVLAALGALADRTGRTTAAMALVYFLAFDTSLAFLTRFTNRIGMTEDLMPNFEYSIFHEKGFRFHPLLQLEPTPGYDDGQFRHTKEGTRAIEAKPTSADPVDVALIGGSSTYDITVAQGETWADHLQTRFPGYRFWNFGVPGYTTVEHVVQTAWYLPQGTRCAIYYFGWNDIRNNNLPDLDPAFANYHLLDRGNNERTRNNNWFPATGKLFYLLASRVGVYPQKPDVFLSTSPQKGFDAKFEAYYRRNVETLIALNKARGVRMGFIGQLLHNDAFSHYAPGERTFGAAAVEDRDVPAVMDHFNGVVAEEAAKAGVPFLRPGQDWLRADEYSDVGHFTPQGSATFAARVGDFIDRTCRAD